MFHRKTGWLRAPDAVEDWTIVMDTVRNRLGDDERAAMARAGVERVKNIFGEEEMARRLDGILDDMLRMPKERSRTASLLFAAATVGVFGVLAAATAGMLGLA